MRPLVNFMPWRQQKRRRCIRFWTLVFIATALAVIFCGALWQARLSQDLYSAMLWQQSDNVMLNDLLAAEKPLRLRLDQWQQAQARLTRRESTQAWRQILPDLAAALPQKAWLTQLRWGQNQLELSGLARSISALSELEQRLYKMAGFHLQPMGAMARDAEGRWQFHYKLNRVQADVSQH